MTNAEKQVLEKNKKEASLKNMYFNRYLMVRYLTAGFFFTNLYWFLFLMINRTIVVLIPFVLLAFLVVVVAEQVKLYSHHTNHLKGTKLYYWCQLIVNVTLLPLLFTPLFSKIFPFMTNTGQSIQLLSIVLVLGIFLCLVILRRLYVISDDRDKHFKRIKQYEKVLHI